MIKKKKKVCKGCGNEEYIWSKGMCKKCAPTQNAIKSSSILKKGKSKIRKSNPKTRERRKENKACLDFYFDYHIQRCNSSEETGKAIYSATRANICHLLPKRTYKSVMCNVDNCVYLTLDEHTRFDYLLDTFQFDKLEKEFKNSWPLCCKRYRKLIPLCEEKGKLIIKLKDYLSI